MSSSIGCTKPKLVRLTDVVVDKRLAEHNRAITRVGHVVNVKTSIDWQCHVCNNVWQSSPDSVLNKKTGCHWCAGSVPLTDVIVDARLINVGRCITRLGTVKNSSVSIDWLCSKCNNIWTASPNDILNNNTGCPQCSGNKKVTDKKIDDWLIAHSKSFERIGQVTGTHSNTSWQCRVCSNVWQASPNNVMSKYSGCPLCCGNIPHTNDSIDDWLLTNHKPFKRLGNIKGTGNPIDWQCHICDHIWCTRPNSIMVMDSGCPQCSNQIPHSNESVDTLLVTSNRSISRVGDVRGTKTSIGWRCNVCENAWIARLGDVLNKESGCPQCNKPGVINNAWFGSNPHKKTTPSLLYFVEGINQSGSRFLKVGITERSLKSRFAGEKKYQIRVISTKQLLLFDAFSIEQRILRKYAKHRFRPDDNFNGKTECFVYDPEIIRNVVADYFS